MSLIAASASSTPILPVVESDWPAWRDAQPAARRQALAALRFEGRRYTHAVLLDAEGRPSLIVVGVRRLDDVWALGNLALTLPDADYHLDPGLPHGAVRLLALGFALGAYQYTRYKPKARRPSARLVVADATRRAELEAIVEAVTVARDLVNTPTEDLGPQELADVVAALAARHGASYQCRSGDVLLQDGFPAIHAVGRASHRAPRLIELRWGQAEHPPIAILGKGVCFDTGGLDLKPADGMALMKKDMGGAAVAIGLAQLVMQRRLPIRLHLLIPAVENAVGPNAYRPGEVIATRAGHRVEIGNTDAEGRVVLCDALTYAAESQPELVLDFATLTGAARIALGPDLPALFGNQEACVEDLLAAGRAEGDPLWAMPLWEDYQALLDSKIADFNNAGSSKMAGCITAALYLARFVPPTLPWLHLDTYCWSEGKPGRPAGGDCQGLRAAFTFLESRYAGD